jgi:hypothetical protein
MHTKTDLSYLPFILIGGLGVAAFLKIGSHNTSKEHLPLATKLEVVAEQESFHLLEPNVINLRFSGYTGRLVWFTGDSGISYTPLNSDPGIEVSDQKTILKPEHATAFMLKGSSNNGWRMKMETK